MKKILLALFLLMAGLTLSVTSSAQQSPVEIPQAPPAVQSTFNYYMRTVYFDLFGRYGTTTWYIDKGVFESITVYRSGSTFTRVFMHFDPKGELLDAYTDL
jgi:hypothetical protein